MSTQNVKLKMDSFTEHVHVPVMYRLAVFSISSVVCDALLSVCVGTLLCPACPACLFILGLHWCCVNDMSACECMCVHVGASHEYSI